jgi:hypothetical protein
MRYAAILVLNVAAVSHDACCESEAPPSPPKLGLPSNSPNPSLQSEVHTTGLECCRALPLERSRKPSRSCGKRIGDATLNLQCCDELLRRSRSKPRTNMRATSPTTCKASRLPPRNSWTTTSPRSASPSADDGGAPAPGPWNADSSWRKFANFRAASSEKVRDLVLLDPTAMGFELVSYTGTVTDIGDEKDYMQSLGATQTAPK